MLRSIFSLFIYPLGVTVFILGAMVYLTATIFIHPRHLHGLAKGISRFFLFICGQWVTYEGPIPGKKEGPFLYMFNHQSMFDGFLLVGGINHYVTGVGANKQFAYPVWGQIVKRYGIIPIKRSELKQAINSLDLLEKALRAGTTCLISPEGTRTLDGKMNPFKKGPFHVAKNTGVTIVPVGINGAFRAKPKNDWRFAPGRIRVRFGDPVLSSQYKDMSVEELRDDIFEKISILAYPE